MSVDLIDGRTITVPQAWYPRLLHATPAQRADWQLAGGGFGIHWPKIDEDLTTEGLLAGAPTPRSGVEEDEGFLFPGIIWLIVQSRRLQISSYMPKTGAWPVDLHIAIWLGIEIVILTMVQCYVDCTYVAIVAIFLLSYHCHDICTILLLVLFRGHYRNAQRWISARRLVCYALINYVECAVIFGCIHYTLGRCRFFNIENYLSRELANVGDGIYFSFVTMSTIGYGDLFPIQAAAKTLVVIQSMIGGLIFIFAIARFINGMKTPRILHQ